MHFSCKVEKWQVGTGVEQNGSHPLLERAEQTMTWLRFVWIIVFEQIFLRCRFRQICALWKLQTNEVMLRLFAGMELTAVSCPLPHQWCWMGRVVGLLWSMWLCPRSGYKVKQFCRMKESYRYRLGQLWGTVTHSFTVPQAVLYAL